MVLLVIFSS